MHKRKDELGIVALYVLELYSNFLSAAIGANIMGSHRTLMDLVSMLLQSPHRGQLQVLDPLVLLFP